MCYQQRRLFTFRRLRILALLTLFVFVAGGTYLQQYSAASWKKPLRVTLYPINADGSHAVSGYLSKLTSADLLPISEFLQEEARAFARREQNEQNNVVITHELLHTLGATDKYDVNGLPVFPDGFADPEQVPLYPQHAAEIMAGRIARSLDTAEIPQSLEYCLIGPETAAEINW